MSKVKAIEIPKKFVWDAYLEVKSKKGSAGIDQQSMQDFEKNLKRNLYKIWNRLSSGSYFPPPVKRVEIPKPKGGVRVLGVPTISDRIAQTVVKKYLEPLWEPLFHEDSYGYRPGKQALDAVAVTRERCWRYSWVVEFDIKKAFDHIDHELLLRAVNKHTSQSWLVMYIERWLKVHVEDESGSFAPSSVGVPQGGVISPLLMNLFMHYTFDSWMQRQHPKHPFARFADDAVVHCNSLYHARGLLDSISRRLEECKLSMHPDKSKVVCCRLGLKTGKDYSKQFTFLGFTFRHRIASGRNGVFTAFLPAVSNEAMKRMRMRIRRWKLHRLSHMSLVELAHDVNNVLRGWWNYFGKFYSSEMNKLYSYFNRRLMLWARRKYRSLKRRKIASFRWLVRVSEMHPNLFFHWQHFKVSSSGLA